MQGLFRRGVVVFYWIALPLALLLCAGWLLSAGTGAGAPRGNALMMAGGAGAVAVLIGWRLWLNSRALGRTVALPSTRQLVLVVLPFALLALAGVGLAALGLTWFSLGVWLLFGSELATSGYRDLVSGAGVPIGGGALMVLIGGGMIVPLVRSLGTRRPPVDEA